MMRIMVVMAAITGGWRRRGGATTWWLHHLQHLLLDARADDLRSLDRCLSDGPQRPLPELDIQQVVAGGLLHAHATVGEDASGVLVKASYRQVTPFRTIKDV